MDTHDLGINAALRELTASRPGMSREERLERSRRGLHMAAIVLASRCATLEKGAQYPDDVAASCAAALVCALDLSELFGVRIVDEVQALIRNTDVDPPTTPENA